MSLVILVPRVTSVHTIKVLGFSWSVLIVPPVRLRFQCNLGREVCVAFLSCAHHPLDKILCLDILLSFKILEIGRSRSKITKNTAAVVCSTGRFKRVVNVFFCLTSEDSLLGSDLLEA